MLVVNSSIFGLLIAENGVWKLSDFSDVCEPTASSSQNPMTGCCNSSYDSVEESDLAVVETEGLPGTNLTDRMTKAV